MNALIADETDPEGLVGLAHRRLKASHETLVEALRGQVKRHHRFLLKLHLDQSLALEAAIDTVDAEVGSVLDPFRAEAKRLTTMPGISDTVAQVIVSEIGVDMARFPTA